MNLHSLPSEVAIFLSYRRDDDGYAGRIFENLSQRYPGQVFRDIEGINLGEEWRPRIERALATTKIFIAVIGKNWAPSRLTDLGDMVRYESATALERGIPVLIALAPGGEMPKPEALPDVLAGFTERQAFPISVLDFWGRFAEGTSQMCPSAYPLRPTRRKRNQQARRELS